jgi:colicin import membrane protein
MPSRTDRNDFGPPSDAGRLRSFGIALLVHGLLIGALTWGVNWKRSDTSPSFSAEIWSSTAQQAAPPLANAPPPPPEASPQKVTPPKVVQTAPPTPAPPVARDVDIALEQEKKRKLAQQKVEREEEAAQDKRQAALEAKAEKDQQIKQEKLQAQALAKQQAASEAKKQDIAKADAKNKTTAAAAALEDQRKQNLARAMGMAGATGGESSTGTAKVASGPTSGYGAKVRAKVKPNIVFTEAADGNPKAEVEVRSALDGTITSQRLLKSSGNKAWDDAVIKAIDRTETMPRDTDGRVPPVMILEFRVRD